MNPDHPHSNNGPGASGPTDYNHPVAYDSQGRPLYAHPSPEQGQHPQVVHVSRALNPQPMDIPAEVQQLAEESREQYPHLNLSDGEFIIAAVQRHPIGLLQIWVTAFLVILIFGGLIAVTLGTADTSSLLSDFGDKKQIATLGAVAGGILSLLVIAGALAATYIYNGNRFYLTNESVIQEIQNSLFSKHEQTVSLSNIEDASYQQTNPLQLLLNYGSIRLSTEGDETTYRFSYVANPKKHIAVLNNAVEAFKNGRPVHVGSLPR